MCKLDYMKDLLKYTWAVITFVLLSTSVSWGLSRDEICKRATTYEMGKPNKTWSLTEYSKPYIKTAKSRNYHCDVGTSVKEQGLKQWKQDEYKRKQQRLAEKELEDFERQEEERKRKERQKVKQTKYDRCIVGLSDGFDNWSEEDASYLCEQLSRNVSDPIFTNCTAAKGQGKSKRVIDSVVNVCADISANPSMFDKLKYGSDASKYLKFLK